MNLDTREFKIYRHDPFNLNSISSDRVNIILTDRENNLWLGTGRGLDRLKAPFQPFITYTADPEKKHGLNSNQITTVLEDQRGAVWFGTYGEGLTRLDPGTSRVDQFRHMPGNDATLNSDLVVQMIEGPKGDFWITTAGGGLNVLDPQSGKFTHYRHDPADPNSLSHNWAKYIMKDRSGNIWVGTQYSLNRFDPHKQSFQHYIYHPDDPEVYAQNITHGTMVEDAAGKLWIPYQQNGISRLDPQTGEFTRYRHDPADPNTISSDNVNGIKLDVAGNLLVHSSAGLDQLILMPGKEPPFKVNRKLVSGSVHSVLPDKKGNLWIGTLRGLIKYETASGKSRKYNSADGLPSDQFIPGVFESSRTGMLYFGTDNGLLAFHPDSLRDNPFIPPIAFTALYYYDDKDDSGEPVEVKNITYLEEVSLPYHQNTLAIEFAALSYNKASKNQYAYLIEGRNDNWIQLGTERTLRLTNLNPGTYPLHVKGSNGDGLWNEEGAILKIVIRPPWWQTNLAKTSYIIALILVILGYIRWRTYALRKRQKELEQTVTERTEEIKKNQQQLIQQEKMASLGQMTAGIAHEIKNPLNFVNNLSELSVELADELKEELDRYQQSKDPEDYEIVLEVLQGLQKNAQLIQDNGQRADGIVSSMMDHANDNQGERRNTDLNALVEEHLRLAYHGYKGDRQDFEVIFEKKLDASLPPVTINPQEIGRVLINLINNACYAVEEKAKTAGAEYQPTIRVSTQQVDGQVEIRIRDNGPGIPADIRDKIFDPFFTTKPTGKGSTGLGLSISYDIVVQGHQGRLWCEGKEGEETVFVVALSVA